MGNWLKPTKVNLESPVVDNSSGKINNKEANIKFLGPEFDKVFHIICQKQLQDGYYQVRQLSKFHQSLFEKNIDQIFIKYENLSFFVKSRFFGGYENLKVVVKCQNLGSFVRSEFSSRVKYLNVMVVKDKSNNLNGNLRFISKTYLPDIKQVNVIFTNKLAPRNTPDDYAYMFIQLNESLIFRGINFICEDKEYLFQKKLKLEIYCRNNNIEILNCNFHSVALELWYANKVTILNSSFKNVSTLYALKISNIKNQVLTENIKIINCYHGMKIYECNNPIINNVKMENCNGDGCQFYQFNNQFNSATINNANINTIIFDHNKYVKIFDCTFKDFTHHGIEIYNSIVQYEGIHFERGDFEPIYNNIEDGFVNVEGLSVFTTIM